MENPPTIHDKTRRLCHLAGSLNLNVCFMLMGGVIRRGSAAEQIAEMKALIKEIERTLFQSQKENQAP